jgi:hypothetical protein
MSAGLSRIDDLLSKMRGVYEADAPAAPAAAPDAASPEKSTSVGESSTSTEIWASVKGHPSPDEIKKLVPHGLKYNGLDSKSMKEPAFAGETVFKLSAKGHPSDAAIKEMLPSGWELVDTESHGAWDHEPDPTGQDEPDPRDIPPDRPKHEYEESKLSADAQDFISKKISKLDKEGYPQKQAIAIAYSMARKAGHDVPEAPKEDDDAPEAEKPKAEVPPMQPRKDEPQSEYMEAFGVPKSALLAAKEELKTYSDFLAKYRDGDVNAFESAAVSENDSELAIRCKSRPPQSWFTEAIRIISQDESVNDPAELAAWLWTHWVPKGTRAKLAGL